MVSEGYPTWLDDDFIDLSKILSYNAVINFLDTPRNRGKTWSIQIRAYKHALRHNKSTILVRRNVKSLKQFKAKAFNAKFCDFFGIDPESIIRAGNIFYIKQGGNKTPMLEVCALSERYTQRSADSGQADLFVIDEANVPPSERSTFRGDPVDNALDIWDSNRRGGHMPMVIFGNRESVVNPFQSYFGIQPLPLDFNGIRRYRDKTIMVAQSTKESVLGGQFNDKVNVALGGTKYSEFSRHGTPRSVDNVHVLPKKPKKAEWYCQFLEKGKIYTIYRFDGGVWLTPEWDRSRLVFSFGQSALTNTEVIKPFHMPTSSMRLRFSALYTALKNNAVWLSSNQVAEELKGVFK